MARNRRDDEPRIWAIRDRAVPSPQRSFARSMRRSPTAAEKKLWWHLHRVSVNGSHFRRQVRLGRYIVDFANHQARLVIEVDGGQHCENAADADRTTFIEEHGYRVLRFWNNDVLGNIEGVLEVIQAAVDTFGSAGNSSLPRRGGGAGVGARGAAVLKCTTPHPIPPPQGGGSPMWRNLSPIHSSRLLTPSQKGIQEQKRSATDA